MHPSMRRRIDPASQTAHHRDTRFGEHVTKVLGLFQTVSRRMPSANNGDRQVISHTDLPLHKHQRGCVAQVAQRSRIASLMTLDNARLRLGAPPEDRFRVDVMGSGLDDRHQFWADRTHRFQLRRGCLQYAVRCPESIQKRRQRPWPDARKHGQLKNVNQLLVLMDRFHQRRLA